MSALMVAIEAMDSLRRILDMDNNENDDYLYALLGRDERDRIEVVIRDLHHWYETLRRYRP